MLLHGGKVLPSFPEVWERGETLVVLLLATAFCNTKFWRSWRPCCEYQLIYTVVTLCTPWRVWIRHTVCGTAELLPGLDAHFFYTVVTTSMAQDFKEKKSVGVTVWCVDVLLRCLQFYGSGRFLTGYGSDFRKRPDPDPDPNKFPANFFINFF
jgi:hypothetical protein